MLTLGFLILGLPKYAKPASFMGNSISAPSLINLVGTPKVLLIFNATPGINLYAATVGTTPEKAMENIVAKDSSQVRSLIKKIKRIYVVANSLENFQKLFSDEPSKKDAINGLIIIQTTTPLSVSEVKKIVETDVKELQPFKFNGHRVKVFYNDLKVGPSLLVVSIPSSKAVLLLPTTKPEKQVGNLKNALNSLETEFPAYAKTLIDPSVVVGIWVKSTTETLSLAPKFFSKIKDKEVKKILRSLKDGMVIMSFKDKKVGFEVNVNTIYSANAMARILRELRNMLNDPDLKKSVKSTSKNTWAISDKVGNKKMSGKLKLDSRSISLNMNVGGEPVSFLMKDVGNTLNMKLTMSIPLFRDVLKNMSSILFLMMMQE